MSIDPALRQQLLRQPHGDALMYLIVYATDQRHTRWFATQVSENGLTITADLAHADQFGTFAETKPASCAS